VAAGALAVSVTAAWSVWAHGLTLSHYDAKAHLVVARRIFDSLTPGWRQIGAVWLPLPHLLNALPVQVDAWYRTGLSGVVISMVSFVAATTGLAALVLRVTGSRLAALAAAAVFASDPNLLYLQSTPMTEPLLLGLLVVAVERLHRWIDAPDRRTATQAGWAFFGACLTRYEAWPATAAALGLAALLTWSRRGTLRATAGLGRIALFPLAAGLGFLVLSRATVGEWFVTGGFFVPENPAHGRPLAAAGQVAWGLWRLVGPLTLAAGAAGATLLVAAAVRRRPWGSGAVVLGLAACAALPWYAFVSGHPFRIRYMVVLVATVAACAGSLVGLAARRLRPVLAALVVAAAVWETPPLSPAAPMVIEAQWDRANAVRRRTVTHCLAGGFVRPDHKILASMGSLAHYMQELSHQGFVLSDFIHEGVGDLWQETLRSPRSHVQWILFEEKAEGGDVLAARRRASPWFAAGFERVCEAGGVALYRRVETAEARGDERAGDPGSLGSAGSSGAATAFRPPE
jgi:hypothetical protein